MRRINKHLMEVLEGNTKNNKKERMAKHFPKLVKYTNLYIQATLNELTHSTKLIRLISILHLPTWQSWIDN